MTASDPMTDQDAETAYSVKIGCESIRGCFSVYVFSYFLS